MYSALVYKLPMFLVATYMQCTLQHLPTGPHLFLPNVCLPTTHTVHLQRTHAQTQTSVSLLPMCCADTLTHPQTALSSGTSPLLQPNQQPNYSQEQPQTAPGHFFPLPGIIRASLLEKLITELKKQKSSSHPPIPQSISTVDLFRNFKNPEV